MGQIMRKIKAGSKDAWIGSEKTMIKRIKDADWFVAFVCLRDSYLIMDNAGKLYLVVSYVADDVFHKAIMCTKKGEIMLPNTIVNITGCGDDWLDYYLGELMERLENNKNEEERDE